MLNNFLEESYYAAAPAMQLINKEIHYMYYNTIYKL